MRYFTFLGEVAGDSDTQQMKCQQFPRTRWHIFEQIVQKSTKSPQLPG